MSSHGINMVNPIRQGEIKYARSFLENEEWLLKKKMTEAQQAQVSYHEKRPISTLETLLVKKQQRIDKVVKQLPTEPVTITYDKDGNAEITIQI